ncbi:MAG TPA: response regulator [Terriglobales bacterium]|nr:response regulator [Terriglobales bacterium]
MRALVVDDSTAMRSVLRLIFKKAGFEVLEAANGYEALNKLTEDSTPVDLAVVDWNMPVMNGYELVTKIRSDERYNGMRIMMVTTESEISHIQSVLAKGANEYVMKPFTPDTIQEKLQILGLSAGA